MQVQGRLPSINALLPSPKNNSLHFMTSGTGGNNWHGGGGQGGGGQSDLVIRNLNLTLGAPF